MIEMSATAAPALALSGAILPAAPASASSEGGQSADFSAVLAGAALVAKMPELTVATEPEPPTPAPIVPELVAASAKPTGRSGPSGKDTGKMLPSGKMPVARDVAISSKAHRAALTDETEDKPAPDQDVARSEQVTVDAPLQTATALPGRAISHSAPQTTVEPAPARPASVVTRQSAASPSAARATPAAEQTVAVVSPSPAPAIVADIRPTAAVNTRTAMSSDTVVASHVMPDVAPGDTSAVASHDTSAATLRDAVMSKAAPASSKAAAAKGTVTDSTGIQSTRIETTRTGINAAVIPQTAAAATNAPRAPSMAAKAPVVATTAANLVPPAIAQPSALSVRTDGSSATVRAPDGADPALARTATPALAATSTSAPDTAPAPATTTPMPTTPGEIDFTLQPATLATAPTPLVMPNTAPSTLQAASSAIIAPVLSAAGQAVRSQASDDLPIAAPAVSVPTPDQVKPTIQVEAPVAPPVAQSTRDAEVPAAPLPTRPLQQALSTPVPVAPTALAAPLATALPVPAPETAVQQAAAAAPVQSQARFGTPIAPQPALGAADPAEHKRVLPVTPTETPPTVSRPEPISIVTGNDMRTAAIFAAPTTASPATTPTQDIAALVDRITEARAAAAPQTIRAALMHEDFGSVSLNFRSEASHIHVTLGSADPGFAPAVQAAAAANLANNGNDDPQHRRDAPTPQANPQPHDATRNDASSQQQQAQRDRANAGERQPSRQTLGREPAHSGERASTAIDPQRHRGIYV